MRIYLPTLFVLTLSACQAQEPTPGGEFENTRFYASDFKPDGSLRAFSEYDFFAESAPCTIFPGRRPAPVRESQTFIGESQFGPLIFECRDAGKSYAAVNFRLFLVGSPAECRSRTWLYEASSIEHFRNLAKVCKRKPSNVQELKKAYQDLRIFNTL